MSNHTVKELAGLDGSQSLQSAFNDVDSSLTVNGFLVGLVGRKVTLAISSTNVSNDTETYTFLENGIQLYVLKIIYVDGSRSLMLSAERTA